jgi:hypothetical protein
VQSSFYIGIYSEGGLGFHGFFSFFLSSFSLHGKLMKIAFFFSHLFKIQMLMLFGLWGGDDNIQSLKIWLKISQAKNRPRSTSSKWPHFVGHLLCKLRFHVLLAIQDVIILVCN